MNRRDRAHQKKAKRDEKRRAVRTASSSADRGAVRTERAAPPPPSPDSLPGKVARALGSGKTEDALRSAATIGGSFVDQGLALGWASTSDVPACKAGCTYCCHVLVAVTVPEVARLVAHAREHLPAEALQRVGERARENSERAHGKTGLEYPHHLPCAMLGPDGGCLAYDARPLMCRKEHSLSVADCKAAFDQADGEDGSIPHSPKPATLGSMTVETYRDALRAAGVDASFHELQEALHIALTDAHAVAAWLEGTPAFASAQIVASAVGAPTDRSLVPLRRGPR